MHERGAAQIDLTALVFEVLTGFGFRRIISGHSTARLRIGASSMQLINRSGNDSRAFSPDRDVAYLFSPAMETVAAWLTHRDIREIDIFLQEQGLDQETLGRACQKFCLAIGSVMERPTATCRESFQASGFLDESATVQVVVLACFGAVFAGIQHDGIREATLNGVGPMRTAEEYAKRAAVMLDVLAQQKSVANDLLPDRGLLSWLEFAISKSISAGVALRIFVRRLRIRQKRV
jgi:hypothetical protein